MRKLISLEMQKYKLLGYRKSIVFCNIAFVGFLMIIYFAEKSEGNIPFESYEMAFGIIGTMTRVTFMIFAAVLIGRIIIDEFKNKSIEVLFTYPISRKKLMAAKLLIVLVFTFAAVLLSGLLIGALFYLAATFMPIVPGQLSGTMIKEQLISLLFGAIATAGISLIPLYVGMKKKSVSATIVTAVLLGMFINSNNNDFTLFSVIAVPISLAALGVWIAYMGVRNIEKTDVI